MRYLDKLKKKVYMHFYGPVTPLSFQNSTWLDYYELNRLVFLYKNASFTTIGQKLKFWGQIMNAQNQSAASHAVR